MYKKRLQQVLNAVAFDRPFRIVLPDNTALDHGLDEPVFTVHIKTARALREIAIKSSLGFGEAYMRGDIDIDGDMQALAMLSFDLQEDLLKPTPWARLRYAAGFFQRRNSRTGSRRNIAAHYDLSNDFYRLWLDEAMQYTCAYFHNADDTLEQAQQQKMDRICSKLRLASGDFVVEAGCGWGGLALHMARNCGVRVKAFNVSAAQIEFARERAARAGISEDRVEYILDDYRNIGAHVRQCDKFASICMIEHAGKDGYADFHRVIAKVLKPEGLAMVQFISRTNPSAVPNPWLEKHVFPGYYNPSLAEVLAPLEREHRKLHVLDVENMRYHYALTLEHWLARFEANAETIRARWGEEVVRKFRLYLNGGLADFAQGGGTLVYQMLLCHGFDNSLPLTRTHHDAVPVPFTATERECLLEPA